MLYIYVCLALLATSCTNVSYNQLDGNIEVSISANLEATITVGDKISGKGTETVILGFLRVPGKRFIADGDVVAYSSSSPAPVTIPIISSIFNTINGFNVIQNAKGQAIHDAITLSNADMIVNPKFTITENDFFLFKTVTCEVSGKKGTVKTIK
ncbi:hypothetical protein OAQ87_00995 [Candidatus Marinimicrobia bacterium]|jgi:hypothetical protein|nr:hypothetical protein [Candidatus Neomarinimicrobiota bacterium]